MPRMSEAEKQKSHARILHAAAQLFRQQGIEKTSVSDVMKAAGMTHGGFYRHFADKADLIAHAFQHAVDDVVGDMEQGDTKEANAKARRAYIDRYLSPEHVRDRQNGCPMAALGSELVRADGETPPQTSDAVERVASLLQEEGPLGDGYAQLALLVGAVTLARLGHDTQRTQAILEAAQAAMDHLPQADQLSTSE